MSEKISLDSSEKFVIFRVSIEEQLSAKLSCKSPDRDKKRGVFFEHASSFLFRI